MAKILFSLTPVQPARWETEHGTGLRFQVAPLSAERDAELSRECTDLYGRLDPVLFAEKVALECIKGWEGMGNGAGEPVAATPENIKIFAQHHGTSLGQWVIAKARSHAHYVLEALEAGKNG